MVRICWQGSDFSAKSLLPKKQKQRYNSVNAQWKPSEIYCFRKNFFWKNRCRIFSERLGCAYLFPVLSCRYRMDSSVQDGINDFQGFLRNDILILSGAQPKTVQSQSAAIHSQHRKKVCFFHWKIPGKSQKNLCLGIGSDLLRCRICKGTDLTVFFGSIQKKSRRGGILTVIW